MKFSVESVTLEDVLSHVAAVVPSATVNPAYHGVHFQLKRNRLTLSATDGETFIRRTIPVSQDEPGEALVPARRVLDILKVQPTLDFQVSRVGGDLHIDTGTFKAHFPLIEVDPIPWTEPEGSGSTIPADDFRAAVAQVGHATAKSESRPILTGIYMLADTSSLHMVATDSYRMGHRVIPVNEGVDLRGAVVPLKALTAAAKAVSDSVEEVHVYIAETSPPSFAARVGDTFITSRVIGGEYIRWADILQRSRHDNVVTFDREQLIAAVRAVAAVTKTYVPWQEWTFTKGKVGIMSAGADVGKGQTSVKCDWKPTKHVMRFNPSYVLDALEQFHGPSIQMAVGAMSQPVVFTDDSGLEILLSPMNTKK